jgi:rod shape-determining protein MreC
MENLLSRYRNVCILVGVLFAQVLGLAVQVRRTTENESSRLIRVWTVSAITPLEKGLVSLQGGVSNLWHSYIYLRGVRQENRELKEQIEQLRLKEVRLSEDAEQAHRLQALLGFKEQYISKTLPAQVIGSSGSEKSRVIYIDKGENAHLEPGMPVITADGIVGKILRVFSKSSQILVINDQSSGAGAILEKSRLQGILQGTSTGELVLDKVMSDEQVQPGERVLSSGGDQVFPKGMPIGVVAQVSKGKDSFLNIRIKPAANLSKLEEVLVITKREEKIPSVAETESVRAADILARRLPSVPEKPAEDANKAIATPKPTSTPASATTASGAQGNSESKPQSLPAQTSNHPSGMASSNDSTNHRSEPQTAGTENGTPVATQKPKASPVLRISDQAPNSAVHQVTPKPPQTTPELSAPEDKPQ